MNRILPFWAPRSILKKYAVEYRWLTKLKITHVMFIDTYILYSYTYTYIIIVVCFTINHEIFAKLFTERYKITAQGVA